jgi:hypothetical protein
VYSLQSTLPTHQSANITVQCTQNVKTVTIQLCLCQCQYQSSMTVGCIMNWNVRGRKWSQPVSSSTAFARRDTEKPMTVRLAGAMDKIHSRYYHPNQSLQYNYYQSLLPEQVSYSYPSVPQYVHTLPVTTSAITHTPYQLPQVPSHTHTQSSIYIHSHSPSTVHIC